MQRHEQDDGKNLKNAAAEASPDSCVTLADAGAPHERARHEHLVLHFLKNTTGANLSVCDTEHSCFDGMSALAGVILPDTSLCIKKITET